MEPTSRSFYHSFPRARPGVSRDEVLRSGLAVLRAIRDIGFVLAPETIVWKQSLEIGGYREIALRQSRMCFTELSRPEVVAHSETFGPFSVELTIDSLRSLGALPVIYMPQHLKDDRRFSAVGASVVAEVNDVKYTINQLRQLFQLTDAEYMLNVAAKGATSVAEDCMLTLQNVDPSGQVVAAYQIALKDVRNLLSYIGYRNAPFDLMVGVLSHLQSLFYPTDDEIHDRQMEYYRQREWRLVNGLAVNAQQQCRPLTQSERSIVSSTNPVFWNREFTDKEGTSRRIDEAFVLGSYEGRHISEVISTVIVPRDAYPEAVAIFGDQIVTPSGA